MSRRPKKILRRGPFFTKFCRSLLLSVSKRGWCNPVVFFDISAMFFSSLHFAIVNSSYWNINLKPKQVKCPEAIYLGRDTTGYGKSIIFHLLPGLFYNKINSGSTLSSSSYCHVAVKFIDQRSDQKKYRRKGESDHPECDEKQDH